MGSVLNSKSYWMILTGVIASFALAVFDETLGFRPEVYDWLQYIIAGGFGLGVVRQGVVDVATRGATSGNGPDALAKMEEAALAKKATELEAVARKLPADQVAAILRKHSGGFVKLPLLLLLLLPLFAVSMPSCQSLEGQAISTEEQLDAEEEAALAKEREEALQTKADEQADLIGQLEAQLAAAATPGERARIQEELTAASVQAQVLATELARAEADRVEWEQQAAFWRGEAERHKAAFEAQAQLLAGASGDPAGPGIARLVALLGTLGTTVYAGVQHAKKRIA